MTLVVAREVAGQLCIVADTQVTDPGVVRASPLDAVLKVAAISPTVAVAFAADDLRAATAGVAEVRARLANGPISHEQACELLHDHQERARRSVDFLVATLEPDARISTVKDGVIASTSAAWLGNRAAYSAFQAAFHSQPDRSAALGDDAALRARIQLQLRMADAMDQTIESGAFPDVAGFVACLASRDRTFRYSLRCRYQAHAVTHDAEPVFVQWGDAARGFYSYTMLTSVELEPVLAVHFYEANFGMLFTPARRTEAAVFRDVDLRVFADRVHAAFGIRLELHGPL